MSKNIKVGNDIPTDSLYESISNFKDAWDDFIYNICIIAIHPTKFDGTPRISINDVEDYNNKGYNIYFSVNPVKKGINQKPKKSDIEAVLYAHLDLDPKEDGKYSSSLRKKILELADDIDCTFTIDSGNGIGLFWRLEEEVTQDEIEAINIGLINHFKEYGADKGTHNVDRIMRLPNTLNYPTKKKLEMGYYNFPTKSKLIKSSDNTYDLDYFKDEFQIDIYDLENDAFNTVDKDVIKLNNNQNILLEIEIKAIVDEIKIIDNDNMSSVDFAFFCDFISEARIKIKNLDYIPTNDEIRDALKLKGLYELRVDKSPDNPYKYDRDDYIKSTIKNAIEKIDYSNDFKSTETIDLNDFISQFSMNKEQLEMLSKEEINIVDNVLFQGQICLIVARPNGGKTLLAKHWAKQIAQQGYKLLYIFEDANMNNYKDMSEVGFQYGFNVLASFANEGKTADDILKSIESISNSENDLSKLVLVMDTFKKFVDVLGKDSIKKFYNTMRRITAKGGTILCLAHANKHLNDDGNLVYDGTNDVKADCDTLYYLYDDGNKKSNTRYATLECDKDRAVSSVMEISYKFDIETYTAEKLDEVIDTRQLLKKNILAQANKTLVDDVIDEIENGTTLQKDLVEFIQNNSSFGRDKSKSFLITLIGHSWNRTKGVGKNSYVYSLIPQNNDEVFDFLN